MNKSKKSLFTSKHILFFTFLIINFHGIVYAMEVEDKVEKVELSDKAQEIVNFLKTVNVPSDEQEKIITYFKNPKAGIPICKIINDDKKVPLRIKLKKILEAAIFAYPLSEWKSKTKELCSRFRRETVIYNSKCIGSNERHKKVNEQYENTNAIKLFKQIEKNKGLKLPPITICEKSPSECYPNFDIYNNTMTWWYVKNHENFFPNKYLSFLILINPIFYKQFSNDNATKHDLSHEIAHIERHIWYPYDCGPYINMLLAKTTLAISGDLTSHKILKNTMFKYSLAKPFIHGLSSLFGIILASSLKYYFLRQEEKKCDLRAIDICESAEGVKETFSIIPEYEEKYSGNKWEILEMKFKKLQKPLEYPWYSWGHTHPSDAKRIRYCEKYAKKQGYDKK